MHIEVPRRRPALIRLTPLIDVVFILLGFFMLASSFLDWRAFEIGVPAEATAPDNAIDPIRIEVRPDGSLRVDGDRRDPAELARTVRELQGDDPSERPVLLQPHADAPVGATVKALDRLEAGGVGEVSLGGRRP